MTIDECKKYLPNRWAEIIQQDPLLMEIFEEHDYDLEEEAVPPFLFQELRGGNIEHLRPIFALYGQTGLNKHWEKIWLACSRFLLPSAMAANVLPPTANIKDRPLSRFTIG